MGANISHYLTEDYLGATRKWTPCGHKKWHRDDGAISMLIFLLILVAGAGFEPATFRL